MASNPPFIVEDQTDEDFFDKLVNDDDYEPSVPKVVEGSDSDDPDTKVFANLSIGDESGVGFEVKGETKYVGASTGSLATVEEDSNTDSLIESNNSDNSKNGVVGSPEFVVSESEMNKSSVSSGGVKEVGWSSFHADSMQNGSHGLDSYSDFFNDLGDNNPPDFLENVNEGNMLSGIEEYTHDEGHNSINYSQYQGGQAYEESAKGQDSGSSQYWENMYPGWKYDMKTGQWHQVDEYGAASHALGSEWSAVSDGKTEVNYLQQSLQSVAGTVTETSVTESVSSWNQVSQWNNNGYPEHMVFDPQYPGWYYDTNTQEWHSLDSYTSSVQSTGGQAQDQNGFASSVTYAYSDSNVCGDYGSQGTANQAQHGSWAESYSNYNQQGANTWQPEAVANSGAISNLSGNHQLQNSFGSKLSLNNSVDQQKTLNSLGTITSYNDASHRHSDVNGVTGLQSLVTSGNFTQQFNQVSVTHSEPIHFPNDYYGSQKAVNVSQQSQQSAQTFSYAPNMGRSSAGRPPHALVTFGFGGKLIVMRDSHSFGNSSYGSQDPVGGTISVLNLMEVVTASTDASGIGVGTCDYFRPLCQHSFPGPLVGGNFGSKELNKWIDERISNCESDVDYRKGEALRLLLSLLKIACQHYGKLRSPFGTDIGLRESDIPESAVAKLFASAKRNGKQYSECGVFNQCLQKLPSEAQLLATASEVQNLLVSGRKAEALQRAQEGQLWGPALVLASQLGDQFYVNTVKQMALHQLVAGSPLRTLCLLIAGQPADVFSTHTLANSGVPSAMNLPQQPVQFGANGMLDDWEENLAVITANRTKDDELVIIHLGDCLWKERSEITAAHICYLVAEANFESYSDSARLCLVGADHWKYPRAYASPEAIQRTELYEYSKVLGNSQFILQPFQPYKLIYAYMLAEVGKVSDSLKYCQAALKSLKTGRAPEVETWKQLLTSLEERIRTHQQGGYATNLAPAKLVGKLLNFIDSTAHRVVGGPPPSAPLATHGGVYGNELYNQPMAPRVSSSQSTMAMSSVMPSASMEPISDWAADGNKMMVPNRSVSEPDFGRTPRQVDSSKEVASTDAQSKASASGGASRFRRFGFGSQLLQKTVGLVLRPRSDRQAKLGEENKFYYDEKLKRWVEEGAELPAEEAGPPPPPTTAAFQNGMSDYNLKSSLKGDGSPPDGSPEFKSATLSEHASGIPPIPTGSNQFSARGRMGVRARYVDTFNKSGGSPANLFQSPSVPSVKATVSANAKFFIPTPTVSFDPTMESVGENVPEDTATSENPTTSNSSSQKPMSSSPMTMQRFPSTGNMSRKEFVSNGNSPLSPRSRRTASWSGSLSDAFSPTKLAEIKPLGEVLGMPSDLNMPVDPSIMQIPMHRGEGGGSFGDELHEVEL